jgi:hypothetical protein
MKKLAIALLIVVTAVGTSFAFGMPGFGKKSKNKPAVSIDEAMASQSNLVAAYVAGNKYDLETKSLIAEALGLRDEASTLKMASESINEGNVKDIPATRAKTEDAQKAMESKMADSNELSDDAKATIGKSLVCLTKCVVSYKQAADLSQSALDSAQSVVKNSSMTEVVTVKKKLDPVLTIAPKVPGDMTSIVETSTKYLAFAKSAGVKPPSDLESALGSLD